MGVLDVIRAWVAPRRTIADLGERMTEVEESIAHVEEHAVETDARLDQAEVRMTVLEAKRENRRRRLGPGPWPPS